MGSGGTEVVTGAAAAAGTATETAPGPVSEAAVARHRQSIELEERAGVLSGAAAAAQAALVDAVADVLAAGTWEGWGIRSPEHWVVLRCGVSHAKASRLVAAARTVGELPLVAEAFREGRISDDHGEAMINAGVTREYEHAALELALVATVPQLRTGLSFLPRPEPEPDPDGSDGDQGESDGEASADRRLHRGTAGDGTWWCSARGLGADEGAMVDAALRAARDDLFAAGQTRVTDVDALVRLAEVGLGGLDPASASGRPASDRYQIHLHHHPDRAGLDLHLGGPLPTAAAALIACDATARVWLHRPDGTVDQSRRMRVVSMPLRLQVELRDGGCVVPGCGATRHLHIHHVVPWAEGGPTVSANLVALCRRHHRDVHHRRLRIAGDPDEGTLTITTPGGRSLEPPPRPRTSPPPIPATANCVRSGERADWRWFDWGPPRRE